MLGGQLPPHSPVDKDAGEWRAEGSPLASGADGSLPGAIPSFRAGVYHPNMLFGLDFRIFRCH